MKRVQCARTEELVALRAAMTGWQTAGRTDTDNDYRQLVCDYVEFLLLTGARHGTEAMGVCWQHCDWYSADKETLLLSRSMQCLGAAKLLYFAAATDASHTPSMACLVVCYDIASYWLTKRDRREHTTHICYKQAIGWHGHTHTLAKQMGTSVAMLERYYSKLTAMLVAERLA